MHKFLEKAAVPQNKWMLESLNEKQRNSIHIRAFLANLYSALEEYMRESQRNDEGGKKSASLMYKESVFKLLEDNKNGNCNLRDLQMEIEELTMKFSEGSIYKQAPNLIQIFIRKDKECAKDYLYSKLSNKDEQKMLVVFGQYTLEALIIHVLGLLFNTQETEAMVRESSLIDQLDSHVRTHYKISY